MMSGNLQIDLEEFLHRLLAFRIMGINRHLPPTFTAESRTGKLFTSRRYKPFDHCRHWLGRSLGQPDLYTPYCVPDQIDIVLIDHRADRNGAQVDDVSQHVASSHKSSG